MKTKLASLSLIAFAVGMVAGIAISKKPQPSSTELTEAIIDGMLVTESFTGTIWKEKLENIVKQAMEDPYRETWIILETNTMHGITVPIANNNKENPNK